MTVPMTLWQINALARWMNEHDDPEDDTLATAHARVRQVTVEGEDVLEVTTEAGKRLILWHDGSDVTDEYGGLIPPQEGERDA